MLSGEMASRIARRSKPELSEDQAQPKDTHQSCAKIAR